MTKQLTKEEILKPYLWDSDQSSDVLNDYDAEKAMDTFAEQECIAFAEWVVKNKYQPMDKLWWDSYMGSEYLTSEKLYELYQQSKEQTSH